MTFAMVSQSAERETIVCTDRYCRHRSPVQYLFAVSYRGHRVAVTVDGDRYDVQIDRDISKTRRGLTFAGMVKFVEEETRGGDD
jgi:hypothetical protein